MPDLEKKTFEIEATPRTMAKVEGLLRSMEYNSNIGHSTAFTMDIDGDGDETLNVVNPDLTEYDGGVKASSEVDSDGITVAAESEDEVYFRTGEKEFTKDGTPTKEAEPDEPEIEDEGPQENPEESVVRSLKGMV